MKLPLTFSQIQKQSLECFLDSFFRMFLQIKTFLISIKKIYHKSFVMDYKTTGLDSFFLLIE